MPYYDELSKEELLKIVKKQEKELKSKKYGLVWDSEREPEQVVLDCEHNLPVLKRIKDKEIKTDNTEDNIIIEGDNYHALTVLNYTHKEKIDVIYIDPPYNTGNKSWKYNNKYVEKDDGYLHSKWLNMMEKRLLIAKSLLKPSGCLICAIDENEQNNLGLLLTKIFPAYKIDCITIIHNPGGIQGDNFSYTHEYAYFVYHNSKGYIGRITRVDTNSTPLRDWGGDESKRVTSKNGFYPIYVKGKEIVGFGQVCADNFHPQSSNIVNSNGIVEVYPIDGNGIERKWRHARQSVESIKDELFCVENDNELIIKRNKTVYRYKTVWTESKYNSNVYGSKLVRQIIDNEFPFPKSLYNVKECLLAVSKSKKEAVILDFFAGSGTTGHAVLEMNKEDGGNRKFILCTNNENNICRDVTYPRIANVINGYPFKGKDKTLLFERKINWSDLNIRIENILDEINILIEEKKSNYDKIENEFKDNTVRIYGVKNIDGQKEGLGGNLQYFNTDFVRKTKNRDQVKVNLTKNCTEMLCVKENIFNLKLEEDDFKIFSSNENRRFLCIYYNIIEDSFTDFIEAMKKIEGEKIIYMFSIDNTVDKSLFHCLKDLKIEAIPQSILDVYRQLAKMNIPVKANLIFTEFSKAETKIFKEKDKDEGARILRIVLEKTVQRISQDNNIGILNDKGKEEKISTLNDSLFKKKVISKVEWEENKTYFAIGNEAAHGNYDDYTLKQVEKFYKHIQTLINTYEIR